MTPSSQNKRIGLRGRNGEHSTTDPPQFGGSTRTTSRNSENSSNEIKTQKTGDSSASNGR